MTALAGPLGGYPWLALLIAVAALLVNAGCLALVKVVRALAPQKSADRKAVWLALKDAYLALLSHRRWVRRHRAANARRRDRTRQRRR